jgi:hypothetical protein
MIDWGADQGHARRPIGSLGAALATVGFPWAREAKTPLEEARIFLRAGAEIEHALLIEYLYAAWSATSETIRSRVAEIAIQEMCHLITVQNLLRFIGAQPHLGRQDQDPIGAIDPFPFSLRPFTKSVLEDFLLAEMPPLEDLDGGDKQTMQAIICARGPSNAINRVGLIYARVYWLLQPNDHPNPEWPEVAGAGFTPGFHVTSVPVDGGGLTFQADPEQELAWRAQHDRGGIFAKVDSRDAALHAVAAIAAQGEGLISSGELRSHFETFLDIYRTTDFQTLPKSPWPTDPSYSPATGSAPSRELITDPVAAALCRVFDARYRILLACLRNALCRDRSKAPEAALRDKYVLWAFDEMFSSIKFLAGPIARRPCKAGGSVTQLAAAPTFQLDSFTLPDDPVELDQLLFDEHKRAAQLIAAALAAGPDAGTRFNLQERLKNDEKRFPGRTLDR